MHGGCTQRKCWLWKNVMKNTVPSTHCWAFVCTTAVHHSHSPRCRENQLLTVLLIVTKIVTLIRNSSEAGVWCVIFPVHVLRMYVKKTTPHGHPTTGTHFQDPHRGGGYSCHAWLIHPRIPTMPPVDGAHRDVTDQADIACAKREAP